MLDQISNLFYDPMFFWGVPLVFSLLVEAYKVLRRVKLHKR